MAHISRPKSKSIGTPGSRARYCPVSIQLRAPHQAGHPSATHHMTVVRPLEDVPIRTVRDPDLPDSQCDSVHSAGAPAEDRILRLLRVLSAECEAMLDY